jgi:hypothetical protein
LAEHILGVCNGNCIGVRFKGSIAKGTSTRYSDIDITINGRITRDIVEAMVFGFETPLMINASENPPGLLIVAYRRVSLDLRISDNDDSEATIRSIVLVEGLWHSQAACPMSSGVPEDIAMTDDGSEDQAIHKGLLKYLSGKREKQRNSLMIGAVAGLKRRRPPATQMIPEPGRRYGRRRCHELNSLGCFRKRTTKQEVKSGREKAGVRILILLLLFNQPFTGSERKPMK